MPPDDALLYERIYLIRRFEERVLESFPTGIFYGTTHTYLGQEANAVGVLDHVTHADVVLSSHRGHGHFLAYGGDPRALFAELMGKATGVCGGRGGSQHLQWRGFYSNGILGGIAPIATGAALAERAKGGDALAAVFLGDGAFGEGVVYEALNMAGLWGAPVLFVVEDNGIAQTTPKALALAGSFPDRFAAFGIPAVHLDTSDVRAIHEAAGELVAAVRAGAPRALVLETCRFGPHSKGDDTRPVDDVARMRAERDPVTIHGARLDDARRREIEAAVDARLDRAYEQAVADPVALAAVEA